MSYCISGSKTVNMLNINSKPTILDTVTPLNITTDMLVSTNDNDCNSHCGVFNPIVGKSPDCGYNSSDVLLNRMKSIDSAVCSMFTPSSSLQLSPSSQIGSTYAIYDSTSSSNTNNESVTNNDAISLAESHLHVPVNQSKSRFILDYDLSSTISTNNICEIQSPVTTFGQNHSCVNTIPNAESVTLNGSPQQYCDYNIEYNLQDVSLPLQSGYVMNKLSPNVDNVLLWQNQSFRYDTPEKEDRINVNHSWSYEDSNNFGNFNTLSALNQLLANSPCKRPITGGHNVTQQNVPFNHYIRAQNVPWSCYGTSQSMPTGTTSSCNGSNNLKLSNNPQSPNNPWNQALVNQKLGLAPAPVNAMNLAAYPPKILSNASTSNGKKHVSQRNLGNSLQSIASTINNITNNVNSVIKSPTNGPVNNKTSNFNMISPSQNVNPSAAGDGYLYDNTSNSSFNYLEKIPSSENLKINFDPQLLDVLRSLENKTVNLSIDDPDLSNNNGYKNQLMFPSISQREERFSRKVFVGGLPPDIDEEEITAAFKRFGTLVVDWPHKAESKSYFPPKGYCFLLFQEEISVQNLIESCIMDENKYYWCVSSPTIKDKPVQIRPWSLADSDFVMDGSEPLDPRKTIFVGGVPRPLRAVELAMIMDRLYGGVCYSGIDTDPELKYPKGAGRVAFSNQQSYIAAISARFVQLQHHEIDKRVEVKPYVLDDQMCDECQGSRCAGKFAPFFCANVTCLQYYCEQCWAQIHSRQGREYHKPLVKEGADRPRTVPFRW